LVWLKLDAVTENHIPIFSVVERTIYDDC